MSTVETVSLTFLFKRNISDQGTETVLKRMPELHTAVLKTKYPCSSKKTENILKTFQFTEARIPDLPLEPMHRPRF
jgi:hypothetical protein